MTEVLILGWLLPSLIAFLIITVFFRWRGNPIETWVSDEWACALSVTILYPIALIVGFIILITELEIIHFLLKERKL